MLVVTARRADVAVCNASLHCTLLPSVLEFKTTSCRFNFGEVAREGRSHFWQQITGKEKSGASMDAFWSSPRLTKLNCKSALPICLGTLFTVKTVLSGILGVKGLPDIAIFRISECFA